MTNPVRLFFIVPPLMFFHFFANAQLQGKIELLDDEITYQVSVIPSIDWAPPLSITNSAQISVRAETGLLNPINLQSITGMWDLSVDIISPPDVPTHDYFSFTLTGPLQFVTYSAATELILFTFQNDEPCIPVSLFDNSNDPFLPPNSLSINIGNAFTILGAGPGVNAYSDNVVPLAECPPPPAVFAEVIAQDSLIPCSGQTTEATLNAIQGEEPYQISWENLTTGETGSATINDYEGSAVFQDLPAGDYVFTLIDNNNLELQENITISEPDPITFDLEAHRSNCDDSANGQIIIRNLTGGTVLADYNYAWSEPVSQTDTVVSSLAVGNYSVTISDDNGCSAEAATNIEAEFSLEPFPEVTHISCNGYSDGIIQLFPIGSNQPFLYNWSGNGFSGDKSTVANLTAGMYHFTITDADEVCFFYDSIEVFEPNPIEFEYGIINPDCQNPEEAVFMVQKVFGAVNGYQISTNGNQYFDDHEFLLPPGGFQTIYIQDGNGCVHSETVSIPTYEAPQIQMEENTTIILGEEIDLNPLVFPLNGLSLTWSPSETLSCSDCPDPIAKPLESVTYHLSAVDSSGCKADGKITVYVQKETRLFAPNVFSPNGDGVNDYFTIFTGPGIKTVHSLQIFNRWGALMFDSPDGFAANNPPMGWDGKFNGQDMEAGIYIYSTLIEFDDGQKEVVSGDFTILR